VPGGRRKGVLGRGLERFTGATVLGCEEEVKGTVDSYWYLCVTACILMMYLDNYT
jgi:hypothetical protein